MNLYNLLGQDAYWKINKKIAKKVGLKAALLLSDLISKRQYFLVNGDLDSGWFFNTVENIELDTTLTKFEQSKAIKILEDVEFIKTEYRGMPKRRYFNINDSCILEFTAVVKKIDHKRSNNLTTRGQKSLPNNKNKDNENKENKLNINTQFDNFWNEYHLISKKEKTDKEAAFKYFSKLTAEERQKALDNIKPFCNGKESQYIKKARTYLADKNFNDEFNAPTNPARMPKTEITTRMPKSN